MLYGIASNHHTERDEKMYALFTTENGKGFYATYPLTPSETVRRYRAQEESWMNRPTFILDVATDVVY